MRSDAPTKGDIGCVWPSQESRSPTVTTNTKVGNKGCFVQQNKINVGKMYRIQKRVPQWLMNAPEEA
jgi:hypothetical protein